MMTGIARIFNNSFRSLLIRNNIALASSSIYSRNPYNVPNFLKSNSTIYCVTSVDYHSKKGRYRTDQHWLDEWEQENRYDHDVVIDTEVFEDEGRSRFYLMLKCTGILCFIFFLNLADIIRIQLRNSAPKSEEGEKGWRDSVYWKNKGFTGFMSLSIVFAAGIPTVICVICYKCVRSLWLLKGGKKVRVQTFAPFFMNSTLEVPVENISGMTSRAGQNYVSFQLKRNDNKLLRLSMSNLSGTFKEPILYDNYVGKFRNLKSS
ncbi:uncharacterized protein LOC125649946 [Ostrea edulis]|uniref:uncharacterized protein LOC125649946 n=1 Tax=Ostrea edulis TaxID=37623 RepID=UPI002094E896|nr:uncharacterized protein LOC125649946 [Ostrea edulis]